MHNQRNRGALQLQPEEKQYLIINLPELFHEAFKIIVLVKQVSEECTNYSCIVLGIVWIPANCKVMI